MSTLQKMQELQLSENLYPIDEVFMTFTQCLLKRASQHETLYWLYEIVASSDHVIEGLVAIYLQFYSIGNTGLDNYIQKKMIKYKRDRDIKHLANVVNNMRMANPTIDSYELVMNTITECSPNKIYKNNTWITCEPPYSYGLLKSIHAGDKYNIGAYLNIMTTKYGFEETYNIILNYVINVRQLSPTLTRENYPNDIFLLSAIIANTLVIVKEPAMRFIAVSPETITKLTYHFTKKSDKNYLKLTERRLYPTHTNLGSNDYARFHLPEGLNKASWYSWEYYCYDSTLWNTRFKKYKAVKNHERLSIDFKNDDYLEEFYEDDNAMDFDEQSGNVQQMSLHEIYVYTDIHKWFSDLQEERLNNSMNEMKF